MRKSLWILAAVQCLFAYLGMAARVPLDKIDGPLYYKNLEVQWQVATNPLPPTVRIYKIVPATFSQNVISNLMHLGGFTESNRSRKYPTGQKIAKGNLSFIRADGRASLVIAPARGCVSLRNPLPLEDVCEEVPNEDEAFALGTNLLAEFCIPHDQIPKEGGRLKASLYSGSQTILRVGQDPITRPSRVEVNFYRILDGIPCSEEEVGITFESHSKITSLEVTWHRVEPLKSYPTASLQQINAWIKEGRARIRTFTVAGPGGGAPGASDIKRITIHNIDVVYSAANYSNDDDQDEFDRLYPYVRLGAEVELGPSGRQVALISCPVISEFLPKKSR